MTSGPEIVLYNQTEGTLHLHSDWDSHHEALKQGKEVAKSFHVWTRVLGTAVYLVEPRNAPGNFWFREAYRDGLGIQGRYDEVDAMAVADTERREDIEGLKNDYRAMYGEELAKYDDL